MRLKLKSEKNYSKWLMSQILIANTLLLKKYRRIYRWRQLLMRLEINLK